VNTAQSNVHGSPYGSDDDEGVPLGESQTTIAEPDLGHIQDRLADYALRRLGNEEACRIEAHLLVCDRCFAELVLVVIDGR
jgi:hypothetical protein